MERFARIAVQALNQVLESPIQSGDLEIPPDPKLGDFAFPCFKLAKQFRKSPAQVSQQIVAQLKDQNRGPLGLTMASVGPYVNFTVPAEEALNQLLKDILAGPEQGAYGSVTPNSRGSWVLEYSSPNVAKPLNIYHLRPTALGAALDRIGRYRGYQVTSINHLGDWGKQYGMLTVAFRIFGKTLESDLTMADLVDLYVKVNAIAEKDPSIEEEAKQAFVKLEQGDPQITALWKKCVEISVREFERSYSRLGVKFDHIWGESFYKGQLTPLLEDLRKKGLLVLSEGAWVVPVLDEDGKELPPCILQKSDGATIYATRDVAAALYRFQKFKFDRMTYIVGGEQRLHFKQVFGVLRAMGLDWVDRCEHIPFGLYRFKDAKMSTRKGNFVTLEEVLTLAKERVSQLMRERKENSPSRNVAEGLEEISTTGLEAITEAVAIGAVVYHDLHTDPVRDVEFDIDRVVDFEGETGPYLQYAHTRCLSILRKAKGTGQSPAPAGGSISFLADRAHLLKKVEEIQLLKTLGQFPLHLERTLTFGKASQLAQYLIDVTKMFGAFYRECQVLGNAPELTHARLMLVEATRRILAQGMGLLGIPRPSRM
jgi:arginyl-tRNA synthetase